MYFNDSKINFIYFIFYFQFHLAHLFQKILQMVVQYFLKDIFGINMQKKLKKMGNTNQLTVSNNKMESDFDWLAKPPRHKLFKIIPYKRKSSSLGYSQAVKGNMGTI